jgi:hypothetical protein
MTDIQSLMRQCDEAAAYVRLRQEVADLAMTKLEAAIAESIRLKAALSRARAERDGQRAENAA